MADLITTEPQVTAINVDEVLKEYGFDNPETAATIVQNGDSTICIPNNTPLEPPAITVPNQEELSRIADELFTDTSVTNLLDESSFDTEETYDENQEERDLDAEEDEDWNTLLETGTVTPVDNTVSALNDVESSNTDDTVELIKKLPNIKVNSSSHNIDETTSRFSGAMWYKAIQDTTVILAGLGGIGSWVNLILSRMKPKQLFIYDDDIVEAVNLSGQLYSKSMIGGKKVDEMAKLAADFSNYYGVFAIPTKFTKDTPAGDIMICGFDNMEARKIYFNAWVRHLADHPNAENCLFIDGRLNLNEFQVFCIKGNDRYNINKYAEEYLFDDWKAEGVECSMKQTTYCSNMIGSVMVNLFTNFVANTLHPIIEYSLPFKTYYNADMMYFKIED